MQLKELSTARLITPPYIVNFGSNLWSDDDEGLSNSWKFRLEKDDTFSYADASKSYDEQDKWKYRYHWFIDATGLYYRVEDLGTKWKVGKWLGFQRVVARLLPGTEITKSEFLKLMENVTEDEEYHDKSALIAMIDHLEPTDKVTSLDIVRYLKPN